MSTQPAVIITMDGPAGVGKSTVAHGLARRLGLEYLDTGAMYRAAALIAVETGIDLADGRALAAAVAAVGMRFDFSADPPPMLLGARDVTNLLRGPLVGEVVSAVAVLAEVRRVLVEAQRAIATEHPRLVTEGRDQGSVVFPDADVRFFLDADVDVRALRRMNQLVEAGMPADRDRIAREIRERDRIDSTRPDGPLVCPAGAIVIDTSHLTREQVVQVLERLSRDHLPASGFDP